MRRRKRKPFDHGEPISRIDTRPMAFVFTFVAVILLIPASVPATHATVISLWDGSADAWWLSKTSPATVAANSASTDHHAIVNRLTLSESDQILWNNEKISFEQLVTVLHEAKAITPEPVLEFEPAPNASYDRSAKVIEILNRSGNLFRITGLETHCVFGTSDWPTVSGPGGTFEVATTVFYDPSDGIPLALMEWSEPCEPSVAIQRGD